MTQEKRRKPKIEWNWRRTKREVNKAAKRLRVGSVAWGCRGHPGVVTELCHHPRFPQSSDCMIKSLIDDVEESCSLYHCWPESDTLSKVQPFVEFAREHGLTKTNIKFNIDNYRYWEGQFNRAKLNGGMALDARGHAYKDEYALKCETAQQYMNLSDDEWAFYQAELMAQGKAA